MPWIPFLPIINVTGDFIYMKKEQLCIVFYEGLNEATHPEYFKQLFSFDRLFSARIVFIKSTQVSYVYLLTRNLVFFTIIKT